MTWFTALLSVSLSGRALFRFKFLGMSPLGLLIRFPPEYILDSRTAFISGHPSRLQAGSSAGRSVLSLTCCSLVFHTHLGMDASLLPILPVVPNTLQFPKKCFVSSVLSPPSFPPMSLSLDLFRPPARPVAGPSPCIVSCLFLCQPGEQGRRLSSVSSV